MESATAAHEIVDVTGINAPVNYAAALQRFYPLLSRLAFAVGELSRSVCIGTYRLTFDVEFTDEGPVVSYKPHKTVIGNPRGDEHTRMYMFVTSPIVMPFPFPCPVKTVVDLEGEMLNQILLPLRDDQKLDFMWRIGNALTDPVRNPCVIIFYGAGGEEGKSVLATNISRVLGKGVEWTVTDLIGKDSKWPDARLVMKLAEKRLIVCDECGIDQDMNYNNIKRWTSNAPVQSDGMSAYLSQTIIGISNKMGFAAKAAINNSIGRRVVIYKMDKELGKLRSFPAGAVNSYVKMQFIGACLSVSSLYERAPMSLEIALYTLFRRSSNFITAGLTIDYNSPPHYCIVSTAVMATRIGVTIDRLVSCFSAMSNRLVCVPRYGTPFVFGLRYTRPFLTKVGEEYVARHWEKEYIDLETLESEYPSKITSKINNMSANKNKNAPGVGERQSDRAWVREHGAEHSHEPAHKPLHERSREHEHGQQRGHIPGHEHEHEYGQGEAAAQDGAQEVGHGQAQGEEQDRGHERDHGQDREAGPVRLYEGGQGGDQGHIQAQVQLKMHNAFGINIVDFHGPPQQGSTGMMIPSRFVTGAQSMSKAAAANRNLGGATSIFAS
ncbi:hypothetical protein BJ546DRAFT_1062309 [Cryomyces antarcticus]